MEFKMSEMFENSEFYSDPVLIKVDTSAECCKLTTFSPPSNLANTLENLAKDLRKIELENKDVANSYFEISDPIGVIYFKGTRPWALEKKVAYDQAVESAKERSEENRQNLKNKELKDLKELISQYPAESAKLLSEHLSK